MDVDIDFGRRKKPQNENFEYFPDKHQQGHDHRLGFMPFAITWYDERHDYWKGTWQDPNKKEMRIKDLSLGCQNSNFQLIQLISIYS